MFQKWWDGYFEYKDKHPYSHWMIINGRLLGIYPTNSAIAVQCKSLKDGYIPEEVIEISSNAFKENKDKRTFVISEGLKIIGDYAFYKSNVESITFPNSITHIDNYSFSNCNYLKEVLLNGEYSSGVHLGYWCFSNCGNLIEARIKTKFIPGYCFYGCDKLKHLYLYDTEYIDVSALIGSDGCLLDVTLHADKGSYVEKFAKKHNFKFKHL